jgi:hypothetical protein
MTPVAAPSSIERVFCRLKDFRRIATRYEPCRYLPPLDPLSRPFNLMDQLTPVREKFLLIGACL